MILKVFLILLITFIITFIAYRKFSICAALRFCSVFMIIFTLFFSSFFLYRQEVREKRNVILIDANCYLKGLSYKLPIDNINEHDIYLLSGDSFLSLKDSSHITECTDIGKSIMNIFSTFDDLPGRVVYFFDGTGFDRSSAALLNLVDDRSVILTTDRGQENLSTSILGGNKHLFPEETGNVKIGLENIGEYSDSIVLSSYVNNSFYLCETLEIQPFTKLVHYLKIYPNKHGNNIVSILTDRGDSLQFGYNVEDERLNLLIYSEKITPTIGILRRIISKDPRIDLEGYVKAENYLHFTDKTDDVSVSFLYSYSDIIYYIGESSPLMFFEESFQKWNKPVLIIWFVQGEGELKIERAEINISDLGDNHPVISWAKSKHLYSEYAVVIDNYEKILASVSYNPWMTISYMKTIYQMKIPCSVIENWNESDEDKMIDSLLVNINNWARSVLTKQISIYSQKDNFYENEIMDFWIYSNSFPDVRLFKDDTLLDSLQISMSYEDQHYILISNLTVGKYKLVASDVEIMDYLEFVVHEDENLFPVNCDTILLDSFCDYYKEIENLKERNFEKRNIWEYWLFGLILCVFLISEWVLRQKKYGI